MDFAALVQTFGFPTAALIIVVWAFVSERVVPGRAHQRQQVLLDRLLEMLIRKDQTSHRAASLAERAMRGTEAGDDAGD